jgi:probable rRNA maturation factor
VNEILVSSIVEAPPEPDRVKKLCLRALELWGIDGWEVSVLFCGDEFIRELNNRYRGIDRGTDVLSFEQGWVAGTTPDARCPAGDIVVSIDALRGPVAENHLERLLIHGMLHLRGMDHNDDGAEMTKIQEKTLSRLKEERIF